MKTTSANHICQLQRRPENIRNICILAHVDHGKYRNNFNLCMYIDGLAPKPTHQLGTRDS